MRMCTSHRTARSGSRRRGDATSFVSRSHLPRGDQTEGGRDNYRRAENDQRRSRLFESIETKPSHEGIDSHDLKKQQSPPDRPARHGDEHRLRNDADQPELGYLQAENDRTETDDEEQAGERHHIHAPRRNRASPPPTRQSFPRWREMKRSKI